MKLLITRPRFDEATDYLYRWTESLIDEATKRCSAVFDLKKERAIRKIVEGFLLKQTPDLVVFNGHGNPEHVSGQDREILIDANNTKLLAKKVIYARACESALILGKYAVRDGASAYIGYIFPFAFPNQKSMHPLTDEWAKDCLECSNEVIASLIKGRTPEEAHNASIKMHNDRIAALLNSRAAIAPTIIWCLESNRDAQVCLV